MANWLLATLIFCGLILVLFAALISLSGRVTHNRRYLFGRNSSMRLLSREERRQSGRAKQRRQVPKRTRATR